MAHGIKILIAGGGIGGLCLAHGLGRAGIGVMVFERDRSRDDWLQAYRIHIRPEAAVALRKCVTEAVWQRFVTSAGVPPSALNFVDEHLTELARMAPPASALARNAHSMGYPISRVTLRNVLLQGLEDVVQFDKRIEHYEQHHDGSVEAFFADGSCVPGDLLVGADGVHSRVRAQLLPRAVVADAGVASIAGQFPVDGRDDRRLPRRFLEDMTVVLPPANFGIFIGQFINKPQAAATLSDEQPMRDHVFWGMAAQPSCFSRDPIDLNNLDLRAAAGRLARNCDPEVQRLIAGSDPDSVNAIRPLTSAPVGPWQSSNVTLLGDAIHTMTPFQGLGGNTAIRDAELLSRRLAEVDAGHAELRDAIQSYEQEMRDYGFKAVRRSLRAAKYAASGNVAARSLFRAGLRAVNALPPLRSRFLVA